MLPLLQLQCIIGLVNRDCGANTLATAKFSGDLGLQGPSRLHLGPCTGASLVPISPPPWRGCSGAPKFAVASRVRQSTRTPWMGWSSPPPRIVRVSSTHIIMRFYSGVAEYAL